VFVTIVEIPTSTKEDDLKDQLYFSVSLLALLTPLKFYAKIFWNLKKKGTPIPTNDIWLAASAMRYGIHLFTNDEHFKNIDGFLLFPEEGFVWQQ